MKRLPAVLAVPLLVPLLALAACSGDDDATAKDPAPTDAPAASGDAGDAAVPAAPVPAGEVSAIRLGTVRDDGSGPQLCLGLIMESWPPQCTGLALAGWDWADHQAFERQDAIRWGDFAVSGHWDGSVLTVTEAIPAALYDAIAADPPSYPTPAVPLSEADEQRALNDALRLPGLVGATSAGEGQVLVDVAFDDGSLQAWADELYGENAVVVTAVLAERS